MNLGKEGSIFQSNEEKTKSLRFEHLNI